MRQSTDTDLKINDNATHQHLKTHKALSLPQKAKALHFFKSTKNRNSFNRRNKFHKDHDTAVAKDWNGLSFWRSESTCQYCKCSNSLQ